MTAAIRLARCADGTISVAGVTYPSSPAKNSLLTVFQLDPATLSDARNQLHWAAQLLSAEADATLPHAADDSHSNFGWDAQTGALVGRGGSQIDIRDFALVSPNGKRLALAGICLNDARDWLSQQRGVSVTIRDYDMPQHAVSSGAAFDPRSRDLNEIARWLTFGQQSMERIGATRIWPHHFDMGFLIAADHPNHSIGGGMSVGDHFYEHPYFYLNPYGVQRPDDLPSPAHGFWTDYWFGAVLTAENIVASRDPSAVTQEFFDSALAISHALLRS